MFRTTFAAIAAGALLFSIQQPPDDLTRPVSDEPDYTPAMTKALQSWIDVDFRQTPLDQAVERLSKQLGVSIVLDPASLANAMVDRITPVTLRMQRVQALSVLDAILRPLNLEIDRRPDHMLVVDKESNKRTNVVRFHPVADLILLPTGAWVDPGATQVIQIVEDTVDRDVWEPNGGDATIQYYRTSISIIVTAPKDTQQNVHWMLGLLRRSRERTRELLARHDLPTLEEALLATDRVAVPPLGLYEPPAYPPAASVIATVERARRLDETVQETAGKVQRLEIELEALKKAATPVPVPPAKIPAESPRKKKSSASSGEPDF